MLLGPHSLAAFKQLELFWVYIDKYTSAKISDAKSPFIVKISITPVTANELIHEISLHHQNRGRHNSHYGYGVYP
ncbi:hypothetical protein D9R99_16255 [Salmonella enterica]|nr:hypothetical protein [Salmonella enterica]EAU3759257.1 hypothetical protein [Salmonella enterica]